MIKNVIKGIKRRISDFWEFLPPSLRFILRVYLLGIMYFTFFRLVLALLEINQLAEIPFDVFLGSIYMGWRFDTSISGYILSAPLIISIFIGVMPPKFKFLKKIVTIIIILLYTTAFLLCSTDIPFYQYFNSRLTVVLLDWLPTPGIMFSMLLQNVSYYPFIALLIAAIILFIFNMKRIYVKWQKEHEVYYPKRRKITWVINGFIYLLFSILVFIGIRGRVSALAPIGWGTAFFSPYPFTNHLGLNPVFTFMRSWLDQSKDDVYNQRFIDDITASNQIKNILYLPEKSDYNSPIARLVNPGGEARKYNVVIVLMESMGTCFLGESGYFKPSITPNLDALSMKSLYFKNFYSSGIHTFNALWSTFLSIPTLPFNDRFIYDMKNMQLFSGIGYTLLQNGYHSLFVCPHDEQFDNLGPIMSSNGFERVVSNRDFPQNTQVDLWGPPDHIVFEKAVDEMNKLSESGQPFITAVLSISNHGPYVLPNPLPLGCVPKTDDKVSRAVEYADWSIGHFLELAEKTKWFDSTIFVFVADHGFNFKPTYDINYWYHKIPLIIYAPKIFKEAKTINGLGTQVDIFPSVMNILNIKYINNTFGIDLFTQERPFAVFCTDRKIGTINHDYFCLTREDKSVSMYSYKDLSLTDHLSKRRSLADSMQVYSNSIFQTAINMIVNHQVKYIPLENK